MQNIVKSVDPDDALLNPFARLGTTLVAAKLERYTLVLK